MGEEEIVPLSLLVHPICGVPDFGAEKKNGHIMILPKRNWSGYLLDLSTMVETCSKNNNQLEDN